jgi:hypothetical protein
VICLKPGPGKFPIFANSGQSGHFRIAEVKIKPPSPATEDQAKEMDKLACLTTTIARKSTIGCNQGTTVYLIDDAGGNTWIMKGFELGITPGQTYQQFAADPTS